MREKITCVCVCVGYIGVLCYYKKLKLLPTASQMCFAHVRTHALARAHSHTHIVDDWSLKEVENKNLDDILNIIDHNDDKLHNISGLQKNDRKHFRAAYIPYNVTEKVLSQFILFGM